MSSLQEVIKNNSLEEIEKLISDHVDVNAPLENEMSPLIYAISENRIDIVKVLIKHHAQLDLVVNRNFPLLAAVKTNNLEIIKILLQEGAKTNTRGSRIGPTALEKACMENQAELIKVLLQYSNKDPDNVYALDKTIEKKNINATEMIINHLPESVLTDADQMGDIWRSSIEAGDEFVKILINKKICINEKIRTSLGYNYDTETPLIYFCRKGNLAIIEDLLNNGANTEISDSNNKTALYHAIKNHNLKVAQKLLDHGALLNAEQATELLLNYEPYPTESTKDSADLIKILVNKGANIDELNPDKETPLMVAVKRNNVSHIESLLSNGASLNKESTTGETALSLALKNDNKNMAQKLIDHGATISSEKAQKILWNSCPNTLEILIKNGANINTPNQHGETLLLFAVKNLNKSYFLKLLDNGAEITPEIATKLLLQLAANNLPTSYTDNFITIMNTLLEKGADINARNEDGDTLLFLSISKIHSNPHYRDYKILEAICDYPKTDMNIPTEKGAFPLDKARTFGDPKLVDMVINKRKNDNNKELTSLINDIPSLGHRLGISSYYQFFKNIYIYREFNLDTLPKIGAALVLTPTDRGGYNIYLVKNGTLKSGPIAVNSNNAKILESSLRQASPDESQIKNALMNSLPTELAITDGANNYKISTTGRTGLHESIIELQNTLKQYEPSQNEAKEHFAVIREAIEVNNQFNKFEHDSPSTADLLKRYNEDKMLMLSTGWPGHGIGIALYKNHLIISNRGEGMEHNSGVNIYEIDRSKVNETYFKEMLNFVNTTQTQKMAVLKSIIVPTPDAKPSISCGAKAQKHGTCTFVNIKSSILGMLYLLKREELENNKLESHELDQQSKQYANAQYKMFTREMRDHTVTDLIEKMTHSFYKESYLNLALVFLNSSYPSIENDTSGVKMARLLRVVEVIEKMDPQLIAKIIEKDTSLENLSPKELYRDSALRYAAYLGDGKMMADLIGKGADPLALDNNGKNCHDYLDKGGHKEFRALIDHSRAKYLAKSTNPSTVKTSQTFFNLSKENIKIDSAPSKQMSNSHDIASPRMGGTKDD